jgi:peptide/nickel transport system substrate-binding protein
MLLEARAELDQTRRKEIYTSMALMMREEGGLILPMFNDFIDASTSKLEGVLTDPAGSMGNALMMNRTWLTG